MTILKNLPTIAILLIINSLIICCDQQGIITIKEYVVKPETENKIFIKKNIEIIIPINGVNKNHSVQLIEDLTIRKNVPNGFSKESPVFELKHNNLRLNKNATIKIKPNNLIKGKNYFIVREFKGGIEFLDTSIHDQFLIAETSGFSSFYVIGNDIVEIETPKNVVSNKIKYYNVVSTKTNPINLYETGWLSSDNLFNFNDRKVLNTIDPENNFRSFVGLHNGVSRKVIDNNDKVGYVDSKNISFLSNHNQITNLTSKTVFNITKENVFVEKTKIENSVRTFELPRSFNHYPARILINELKPKENKNHKLDISENFQFEFGIGSRNGNNYILISLISNSPKEFIKTYRGGLGLTLSKQLLINDSEIELNYYDDNGKYIDAVMLPINYEDYLYVFMKTFSGYTTPLDADKVKSFMEKIGVGEYENLPNNFFEYDLKNEQNIGLYYGSYQSREELYPEAHKLEIVIPVSNSIDDLNKILSDNSIRLLLGTYIKNSGRTMISQELKLKCDDASFDGNFDVENLLSHIYERYEWMTNEEFKWFDSEFVESKDLEEYKHENKYYQSKVSNIIKIDENSRLVVVSNIRQHWSMGNILYSFFLFKKCNGNWILSNRYSKEICCEGLQDVHHKFLGNNLGVFVLSDDMAQGYIQTMVDVLITNGNSFNHVLNTTVGESYVGSYDGTGGYDYNTEISTTISNSSLPNLVFHKSGTYKDYSGNSSSIYKLDSTIVYKFNGSEYVLKENN